MIQGKGIKARCYWLWNAVLSLLAIDLIPKPRDERGQHIKQAHETLYHFHKPETEAQANEWLLRYLLRYNDQRHRSEKHSRLEDWLTYLPAEGGRDMCTWEQFCRFAREPERRKVGNSTIPSYAGPNGNTNDWVAPHGRRPG
ncbi:hypothetical protein BTI_2030 [Burkholderia thailandensis MSMB121]|nr:hypothetical protein BTI_2030 [Burkholderia thailandensis MSMB121]